MVKIKFLEQGFQQLQPKQDIHTDRCNWTQVLH